MKIHSVILFVLTTFSCNTMKTSAENEGQKSALYTTLYSDTMHGKENATNLIVKNQRELEVLYNSVLNEEVPEVDFSKNQVVALFQGNKNTGGYHIAIERVAEESRKIVVFRKTTSPEPGGLATMVLTSPFVIAEIHSTKQIIFRE